MKTNCPPLKIFFKLSPGSDNHGFTLAEVMVTVVIIGVLAAITGPMWRENTLRAGTNQAGSLLRQIRMRAMSNTTAYRVRPDPTSIIPGTQLATRFLVQSVQSSASRSCGSTTNISSTVPPSLLGSSSIVPVNSIAGFSAATKITIGASTTVYDVIGTTNDSQIIVGSTEPASQGTALLDAEVSLAADWRSDAQTTGITLEDLTLPSTSSSEAVTIANQITVSSQNIPWSLCFDNRGMARLFNAQTGREINSDLQLNVQRCRYGTNCSGENQMGLATISVTRSGAVTVPASIQ